jgi:glycosyltransferase involved in cell wall biosynthesis
VNRSDRTYHLLQARPYPAKLSIVIPLYNEEEMGPGLRRELETFAVQIQGELEFILVNDGSRDRTLDGLLEWASADRRVKVLHLSKNFGHQIAATAGLDEASGDAVVLMDGDLQDPPAVIHRMIACYQEGYDVVYGQRERRRGESAMKLVTAWAFYRLMHFLVYPDLPVDTGDFRLISRNCLNGLTQMRETHRFLRGMVAWVGYPQVALKYQRDPRREGQTKYPWIKAITLAWTAATSFSTLPLKLSWIFGCLVGLFGIEESIRALLANILGWYVVPGWTSLMVVTSLLGAMLLISVGVLGQYVGKIYEQAKGRPLYLVSRKFNCDE